MAITGLILIGYLLAHMAVYQTRAFFLRRAQRFLLARATAPPTWRSPSAARRLGRRELDRGALGADQRLELRRSRVSRAYAELYALEWMDDPWCEVEQAGEWLLELERELGVAKLAQVAVSGAAVDDDQIVVLVTDVELT